MAYNQSPGRMNMPKTGTKHTGKKVKVTTTSGKEIELDTRSSEYKALKARKTKKGDKDTVNVFGKGDIHYAGLKRN